jgi:hypothetical protein
MISGILRGAILCKVRLRRGNHPILFDRETAFEHIITRYHRGEVTRVRARTVALQLLQHLLESEVLVMFRLEPEHLCHLHYVMACYFSFESGC